MKRSVILAAAVAAALSGGEAPGSAADYEAKAEQATFTVAEGFEVTLWASEPAVVNPVQINFDARGRLWAACLPTYPHLYPEHRPADRIVVLEDADGDGRAEKATDFAQGLLLPNGVLPGDGGCYVACHRELLHLADTDGDGKADRSRVLLSGFGNHDTHHTVNSLRWGRDGRVYFNQGVYIQSHVETAYGLRSHIGGGVWAYEPRTQRLELADATVSGTNCWGHSIDAWGRSFIGIAWPVGVHALLPGIGAGGHGGVVAAARTGPLRHCGGDIVGGPALGEDMQGVLVSGDFKGRRVQRLKPGDNDGAVSWKELPPLIAAKSQVFRPVDVKLGPDGAIYVADWCNLIINHAEVDFLDKRRDRAHGRIWRIARTGAAAAKPPRLHEIPIAELLARSVDGDDWTRMAARLALRERPAAELAAALPAWSASAAAGADRGRLEALWTHRHCGSVDAALLAAACAAQDERVRAAALRVAADWRGRVPEARALIAAAARDAAVRVRIEAAYALCQDDRPEAAAQLAAMADGQLTPPLELAIRCGLGRHAKVWKPALTAGSFDFGGNAKHRELALACEKQYGGAPPAPKL